MQIKNTTSISTEKIRELIRFCKPSGVSNFDVMIKNSKCHGVRGRAYLGGSSYHYSKNRFVVLGIGKTEYPRRSYTKKGTGYLSFILYDKLEEILFVLAHELRHLWQKKVRRGHRVWGARGQFSERDADAYAIRIVRRWRSLAKIQ